MPKKLTQEEVIQRMNQINPNIKWNTFHVNSENIQNFFKKSKTNIRKKSHFSKQSKLVEHLGNFYWNHINGISAPEWLYVINNNN